MTHFPSSFPPHNFTAALSSLSRTNWLEVRGTLACGFQLFFLKSKAGVLVSQMFHGPLIALYSFACQRVTGLRLTGQEI